MCGEFLNEQQIERDTRRKENIKEKNQSSLGYSKNNKKEMDSNNNCYAVIGDSEPLAVLIHSPRPPARTL